MAMDIGSVLTESEIRRQQQLRDRSVRESRVQWGVSLARKFFSLVRSLIYLLFSAAVVFLLIAHRREISQKFNAMVSAVQKKDAASPLRKTALDYEHEVDEVTK